ncbi:hypothetical protein [Extibacter muris]|uniref:Uncharacterized protein n=1 Tax=Extibacter muris TaxID=1796622 RepID=A0A4R4FCD7_9FIRM|nr:hypothetical protein [Extibacter muris]MCU0080607.1 hypothetical protein [Extibacter muris]TDA20256.1 hypothetical protein E1963_18100 [Extibacter muris]
MTRSAGCSVINDDNILIDRRPVYDSESFADSILYGTPVSVTVSDGVEPIRMVKAAQMSLVQRRPVKLCEILEC